MTATIHSLSVRVAFNDTAHLPVYAQQQLAEDLQELSWVDARISDGWYDANTIDYGDGRGRCIYLWLPDAQAAHRLTINEVFELIELLTERCARPGKVAGSGRVELRIVKGDKR
jgi:hypothetical protein